MTTNFHNSSLGVTLLLLPLVLYRIHLATTRLVMESSSLSDWVMVRGVRTSSPQQLVVPGSYDTSTEVPSNSTTTHQPVVYTLQCQPDKIIQGIVQDKLAQVRLVISSNGSSQKGKMGGTDRIPP